MTMPFLPKNRMVTIFKHSLRQRDSKSSPLGILLSIKTSPFTFGKEGIGVASLALMLYTLPQGLEIAFHIAASSPNGC